MCFRFLNRTLNATGRFRFCMWRTYSLAPRGNLLATNSLPMKETAELARKYVLSLASLLWNCKARKEEDYLAPSSYPLHGCKRRLFRAGSLVHHCCHLPHCFAFSRGPKLFNVLGSRLKLCQVTPLFSILWNQVQGKGEGVTYNSQFLEDLPQANNSAAFNICIKSQPHLRSLPLLRKLLQTDKQAAGFSLWINHCLHASQRETECR